MLSANFSIAEATKSQTAERLGIDNTPPDDVLDRMVATANAILEPVRDQFGPFQLSSMYRCPELNKAIGSKPGSQHVTGEAADFEVTGVPNHELAEWIRDNLDYDQCILEFHEPGKPNSGWVHCSFRSDGSNRQQCLTINSTGTHQGFLT